MLFTTVLYMQRQSKQSKAVRKRKKQGSMLSKW